MVIRLSECGLTVAEQGVTYVYLKQAVPRTPVLVYITLRPAKLCLS